MRTMNWVTVVALGAALAALQTIGCSDDSKPIGNKDLGRDQTVASDAKADASKDTAQSTDTPKQGDGTTTDKTVTQPEAGMQKGAIVISELMISPAAGGNTVTGEWFEVHNPGTTAIDLLGWKIQSDRIDDVGVVVPTVERLIDASVKVAPGGYAVIGRTTDSAKNGGAPVAWGWEGGAAIFLGGGATEELQKLTLLDKTGAVIEQVTWTFPPKGTWAVTKGASLSRKNLTADPNNFANWCVETTAWKGSAGDKGTPGAKAGCAP